ncbi:hypothetical protein MC885_014762 [Smutsia gigantea]|nr:hypothetical protein MC885_014762 [Smutsia gigantea]
MFFWPHCHLQCPSSKSRSIGGGFYFSAFCFKKAQLMNGRDLRASVPARAFPAASS